MPEPKNVNVDNEAILCLLKKSNGLKALSKQGIVATIVAVVIYLMMNFFVPVQDAKLDTVKREAEVKREAYRKEADANLAAHEKYAMEKFACKDDVTALKKDIEYIKEGIREIKAAIK